MNKLNPGYLSRAAIWLFITTLVYFLMNGAQIFETLVIVPKWTASPPESFLLFKGPFGLDFKAFWIGMHSVHEITFILAIVFSWKLSGIRNGLVILFVIHFAVRVWTLGYFAPNIIEFQEIANGAAPSGDLLSKATLWKNLNYLRVGLFVAVSLGLLPLYAKALKLKNT